MTLLDGAKKAVEKLVAENIQKLIGSF